MYKFIPIMPHRDSINFRYVREDLLPIFKKNDSIAFLNSPMWQKLPVDCIDVAIDKQVVLFGTLDINQSFTQHDENIMGLLQEQPKLYYFLSRCKYARAMIIRKIKGK